MNKNDNFIDTYKKAFEDLRKYRETEFRTQLIEYIFMEYINNNMNENEGSFCCPNCKVVVNGSSFWPPEYKTCPNCKKATMVKLSAFERG